MQHYFKLKEFSIKFLHIFENKGFSHFYISGWTNFQEVHDFTSQSSIILHDLPT